MGSFPDAIERTNAASATGPSRDPTIHAYAATTVVGTAMSVRTSGKVAQRS
ncbi:MAG: hypothetical protein AB7O92_21485 [Acidimicrobiia bacterium]